MVKLRFDKLVDFVMMAWLKISVVSWHSSSQEGTGAYDSRSVKAYTKSSHNVTPMAKETSSSH